MQNLLIIPLLVVVGIGAFVTSQFESNPVPVTMPVPITISMQDGVEADALDSDYLDADQTSPLVAAIGSFSTVDSRDDESNDRNDHLYSTELDSDIFRGGTSAESASDFLTPTESTIAIVGQPIIVRWNVESGISGNIQLTLNSAHRSIFATTTVSYASGRATIDTSGCTPESTSDIQNDVLRCRTLRSRISNGRHFRIEGQYTSGGRTVVMQSAAFKAAYPSGSNATCWRRGYVPHGDSEKFFSATTSPSDSCAPIRQTRTCTNGVLSGDATYGYANCRALAPAVPIGPLGGIEDGYAHGWTLDPNTPTTSIKVHFYLRGGSDNERTFIGATEANIPRPDVNKFTGYAGNHGFRWEIPPQPLGTYMLYAYGINSTPGGSNALLSSPKPFTGTLPPETTPPTVSFTAPASGATVSGAVMLRANATDNVRVASVRFAIGTTTLSVDTTAPYEFSWNTATVPDGTKTLRAVARDTSGNRATSSVTVIVENTRPLRVTNPVPIHGAQNQSTSTTLSWQSSAPRFAVYFGTSSTTPAYKGTQAAKTFNPGLLLPNTVYYWRINPANAVGTTTGAIWGFKTRSAPAPTDTTPPTVSLTAPASGATVSGTIPVSATASDNLGVSGVQFKLDGVNLQAEDATSPYSINWNTTSSTNGSHTLVAVARDAAGNRATSTPRTVTVSNTTSSACATGTTVNVKDFGVVGDGGTDDTVKLQGAFDCLKQVLNTQKTATLYFPPGTYIVNNALTLTQGIGVWNRVTIKGAGIDVSTLQTNIPSPGIFKLNFASQVPTAISDLTLFANSANAGTAIAISMPPSASAPRSLVMKNLVIKTEFSSRTNNFYIGLQGVGLTNPLFDNVSFRTGKKTGPSAGACVHLRGGYGVEISGKSHCWSNGNGLDIEQLGGIVYVHSVQFGTGTKTSIRVNAGGGVVRVRDIHFNSHRGIDIDNAGSVNIDGVYFLGIAATATTTPDGDIKISNSNNITISRNIFSHHYLNPNRTSVFIGTGNSNVKIVNNIFKPIPTGIFISTGVNGTQVLDNRFLATSTMQTTKIVDHGTGTIIRLLPDNDTILGATQLPEPEDSM